MINMKFKSNVEHNKSRYLNWFYDLKARIQFEHMIILTRSIKISYIFFCCVLNLNVPPFL